jgi:DnaJ-class molecular chaperone
MEQQPNPIQIMLDPAKYGYVQCGHCNGYGSSLKESAPKCTRCGGLGLVKTDKENT